MKISEKILKLEALKKKLNLIRRQGKKIAFTNGCFDLMHIGHVKYLEQAKLKNHVLIVGLNSDISVKKIKDPSRPIVDEKSRAAVLAALASVDFVTLFSEETPYNLISHVRPDVLIKGADWKNKGIVGSDIVQSYGGKIKFIKYVPGYSTTSIIETIRKKCLN